MSLLFMILVVAVLPLLAAFTYRNIRKMEAEIDAPLELEKGPIYLQSIVMQSIVALVAWFTADMEHLPIRFQSKFDWQSVLAAVAFVGIALSLAAWSKKSNQNNNDTSTLKYILPSTVRDRLWWIVAVMVAAFCEEYVYRGVLYQLLLQQTGGLWVAAVLLSAIVFAFGHGTQGEKAILQIIPFALGFHLLVYLSGGLLLPMIAHFVYNIAVELLFGNERPQGNT